MVVPRQEISIDGSGFTKAGEIPANSTDIGGTDNTVHAVQLVNNNGDISFNVRVPLGLAPGTRKIEVRDNGGRVGTGTITIAEPAITLDPDESLIGSTVKVSGSGFPANDLVLIKYNGNTVETAATSATGAFEDEILVPSGTAINPGGEYTVSAESQIGVAGSYRSSHRRGRTQPAGHRDFAVGDYGKCRINHHNHRRKLQGLPADLQGRHSRAERYSGPCPHNRSLGIVHRQQCSGAPADAGQVRGEGDY